MKIDYKRLRKYEFFKMIESSIKTYKKEDGEAIAFAIALMAVAVWELYTVVPSAYIWTVWIGIGVLFVMLLLSMRDSIKFFYALHKKVASRLNTLSDHELRLIECKIKEGPPYFCQNFVVAPRIMVYYKDIVSIQCQSKIVKTFNKKQIKQHGFHFAYEFKIIISTADKEKWYLSINPAFEAHPFNAILEELLLHCNDDVKVIGKFPEQEQLIAEANEIAKVSDKLLDAIAQKNENIFYDMFDGNRMHSDFKKGIEYIFNIFTGSVISVENYRSHAALRFASEEAMKIGIGRYRIKTEDNEYYMFFAYNMLCERDQGKLTKLKLVPVEGRTEKEFFIEDAGMRRQSGIYHPGWDESTEQKQVSCS